MTLLGILLWFVAVSQVHNAQPRRNLDVPRANDDNVYFSREEYTSKWICEFTLYRIPDRDIKWEINQKFKNICMNLQTYSEECEDIQLFLELDFDKLVFIPKFDGRLPFWRIWNERILPVLSSWFGESAFKNRYLTKDHRPEELFYLFDGIKVNPLLHYKHQLSRLGLFLQFLQHLITTDQVPRFMTLLDCVEQLVMKLDVATNQGSPYLEGWDLTTIKKLMLKGHIRKFQNHYRFDTPLEKSEILKQLKILKNLVENIEDDKRDEHILKVLQVYNRVIQLIIERGLIEEAKSRGYQKSYENWKKEEFDLSGIRFGDGKCFAIYNWKLEPLKPKQVLRSSSKSSQASTSSTAPSPSHLIIRQHSSSHSSRSSVNREAQGI